MNITAMRDALRTGHNKDLDTRRKVILLSALGLLDFSIISLYQTGVINHLPDIEHPLFDSDKVNASEDAYRFGTGWTYKCCGLRSYNGIGIGRWQ